MIHLESAEPGRSRCGKTLTSDWLTRVQDEVSCSSCTRTWDGSKLTRSEANKKARLSPGYADSTFTGTGALSCYVCGNPIRDHKGWPCSMRVDVMR